ncbi:MAG TPA: PAS domain-containing protein, partial [Coriobacteriia bacterium]|nr:PAS domain-containing protein [Coriobacteriia bacterium]
MTEPTAASLRPDNQSHVDLALRLLDVVPVPMGYLDTDLVVRLCGKAAAEALHRSQEDIVGRHIQEVFGSDDEATRGLEDVLATKSQRSFMMTSSPDSGPERHWEVLFVPDLTDGRLDGIIAVGFDVSDLIEAQEQVSESERMYRSIGELLPFGTWTANEDGALTYVSDSFAEMTGRDKESLLGWAWLDLLPSDEDRRQAASAWHHTLANSDIRDTKHVVRSGDGSYRHLLCRGVRLSSGRDGSARWAGIHVDVTDTERQLRFRDALGVVKDMLVKSLDTDELLAQVGEA